MEGQLPSDRVDLLLDVIQNLNLLQDPKVDRATSGRIPTEYVYRRVVAPDVSGAGLAGGEFWSRWANFDQVT